MMLARLLFVGLAAAGAPGLPRPDDPAPGECDRSVAIRAGAALPAALHDGSGRARCSAVAEPLSSYAHLLKLEVHANVMSDLYRVDIARLEAENRRLSTWYRQPWFVAVTTSALVAATLVAYDWSTRGQK